DQAIAVRNAKIEHGRPRRRIADILCAEHEREADLVTDSTRRGRDRVRERAVLLQCNEPQLGRQWPERADPVRCCDQEPDDQQRNRPERRDRGSDTRVAVTHASARRRKWTRTLVATGTSVS